MYIISSFCSFFVCTDVYIRQKTYVKLQNTIYSMLQSTHFKNKQTLTILVRPTRGC